ncbi:MAG TPA: glycine cleavage system aminomethyltransferase GcvT [Acidobacteriota bacterium]|nr:glycine cleavage system aminomethyltransferase GcvT [bacterium]HNX18875.1 glycine cleavage system aminomethyltransferase GcvT [Acidobacteriota bacterium]
MDNGNATGGSLLRTPLYERHAKLGAKLVPFAGWEMPVQYTGVIEEHKAVRSAAGLFDVSHMGEFEVRGPGAGAFLDHVTPSRISALDDMRAQYTALTTPQGTFVDDFIAYRVSAERILLVVNASNLAKDWAWFNEQAKGFDVELVNLSDETALLAFQGPKALKIVAGLAEGFDALAVKYYHLAVGKVAGCDVLAARTGYTGELGYELFVKNEDAGRLWDALLDAGKEFGAMPAGLGARDTLRLEAAMPLYGNDIDDQHTVLEAGLEWVVDWTKPEFLGRAPLAAQKEAGLKRVRCGFEIKGKGIARHGADVLVGGEVVGPVTSGTFAPWVEKAIGMTYLPPAAAQPGTPFEIDVRGRRLPAEVVPLPFYTRPKKKKQ